MSGAIATLKTDPLASPVYGQSYNLGATGLRGWIFIDRNNMGADGLQTAPSRQILVTVVGSGTPASGMLAVDDVILGAKGGTGTVPAFTSDCRKALGWALGDAETAANAGVLSLLRWRAGTTTTVSITLPVMGSYTASAPYDCPKSALILANARNFLVAQLIANPSFLTNNLAGAVNALALLGGVAPADPNYATVHSRLQAFAHGLTPQAPLTGCDTWNWGYIDIFLSEYYLRSLADGTADASVLPTINAYTVALAKGQSMYGTYGHRGAEQHADGSLHGSIAWYGPVNSAGIPANIGVVMGRKALLAGGQPIDAEIDPAIQRADNFFGWYVNKGSIPYGAHEPYSNGHASNGKDAMCAVLFGLQDSRPAEAEFFTRVTTAGCTGREYGHTGQGFSYLWGAMGSNMGGQAAAAAYLNNVRWHLDLERRSDGSFVYDGGEQYGAGTTADGTYLGTSELYGGMIPTAWYVLTYALPLQRLYLTGSNANPANTLDATKVAHSIAAATYKFDCTDTVNFPIPRLMTDLGDYDPAIRSYAATELANRTLTTPDQTSLITLAEGSDANTRMGACETLGLRLTTAALPALGRRLSDSDYWVRGKAANALRNFGTAASPQLTPMLTAFVANATDPNVIVWTDPIQIANGYLADTLFQSMGSSTIAADKSLLYPAVRAGLKQPDGMARGYLNSFIQTRLTWSDVQAVAPSIIGAVAQRSPADRMFSDGIRDAGLQTLGKYKVEEGIPLCLMNKEQEWHSDDWTAFNVLTTNYRGAAKDALPTLYKWQAHLPQFAADSSVNIGTRLADITSHLATTIAAIQSDTSPPTLANFKSVTATASPASVTMPLASSLVSAAVTDLDGGTPNYLWSKVSGAGNVSFTPNSISADSSRIVTFDTPGTYVLRASAVDRSILDSNIWITYSLGYFDFQTYDQILGAVTKDITVIVGADPNRAPLPQNQGLTTAPNTAAPCTLVATDANGDTLTYAVVAQPSHGTLSGTPPNLVYTPTTGFTGLDSFTFKANDGKLDSPLATVTIDVGTSGNRRPVAVNQAVTTPESTTKSITLAGTDPDGNPLTYTIASGPSHGTLSGTPPNLAYQPAANYPGTNFTAADSFAFTVSDGSLTSAAATVSITVTPVNGPPQATPQSVSALVNTPNPITLAGTDPEGYALAYAVVTTPSHGTLAGTAPNLTYMPALNFHSSDSFTFAVTDSERVVSPAATVSITVVNDPPVANAQYVELQPNTSTPVTLSGSDDCNDALTFAVVAQPAHGTLSGTAPNLTYTPTAAYTGADSFTFKVNDGTNDSAAATVSLNVVQWQTWTNGAAGNWSAGTSWTGGVAPGTGGSSTALLVFNATPYAGTSSNDLAGAFQLNRLNFGSSLPALTLAGTGGSSLSFVTNSAVAPQINQASPNSLTLSNTLALAASTTIGGTGSGALTFSGVISGAGGLIHAAPCMLTLANANSYAGGTTVTNGTLALSNKNGLGSGPLTLAAGITFKQTTFEGNSASGALPNAFVLSGSGYVTMQMSFGEKDVWLSQPVSGSGGFAVQGGTRSLTLTNNNTFSGGIRLTNTSNRIVISNPYALGTGTFRAETLTAGSGTFEAAADLSAGAGVANAFDIAAGAYLNVLNNNNLLLSGPLASTAGSGSLYKAGTAILTLSGTNTYSGSTTVAAGTLACTSAAALGHGPLAITSSAKLNLNFSGTRQVASLALAGVAQANGTYGSTSSPASNKNNSYFSGTGTLTVGSATTTTLVLTGGSTSSNVGDALTFTASVNGSTPTGNVSFYAGTTLLGTSALSGALQASLTTNTLAAGSSNVTAQYAGDTNNTASTSPAVAIQIAGALTPPAAPASLAAIPSSKTISLSWTAAGSATSYVVKRSLTSGGPYAALGFTSLTTFSDTPLSNGTSYYYVVSATNAAGEGANSSEVGATPFNHAPVASAQSVTVGQDIPKAIVLAASDADSDPLTFASVTAPAHGSLSGTAPNITYIPTSGYSGADSFTFKANDGTVDSAPATVTLNVIGWVTWSNIAPGNWSAGASWSGGTAPAAGGSLDGLLVFNTSPYAAASTDDLAGSFQLNRVNLGSSLPAITLGGGSGTSLQFVPNSGLVPPQINQNGGSAITLSNILGLASNLTVGGTGAGALTLSGAISGSATLTKTCSGNVTLSGTNTYSGGTAVSSGTFTIGNLNGCGSGPVTLAAGTTLQQANFEGNSSAGALPNSFVLSGSGNVIMNMPFGGAKDLWLSQPVSGSGGMTVQGGTRTLTLTNSNTFGGGITLTNTNNKVAIAHANALGSGTFRSLTSANSGLLVPIADLSSGSGVGNACDIGSGAYLNVFANGSSNLQLSGPITSTTGSGNLYKSGTAILTLSGSNSYTGSTTVTAGTLACASTASLGHGPLAISTTAKVNLNFSGSSQVSSLALGGTAQANGSYGSTASAATYKNDTWFGGSGVLGVGPATTTALALTGGATPSIVGASLTFTATLSGNAPTGNVSFYAGATLIGTSALNGSFKASVTTNSLAIGSYNVTAQYAGNANNAASTSAAVAIEVLLTTSPPAPPANLAASAASNAVGLTWTASSSASSYTLKRAATSGGPYLALGNPGSTAYNDTPVTNGTTYYYVVSATNGIGESADSGQVSATPVATASATTVASSPVNAGSYGAPVTFTATVTATATGTVAFKDGTTVLGTGTVSANQATYTTSALAVGNHAITATYGGDAIFAPSTSTAVGFTANKLALGITGVTASDKVYDGTTAATLTGGAVSGTVLNGETVTVVAGSGSFASANVGSQAVTASAFSLGGANAGNYVLSAQPSVPNSTITARPLQLAGTREYDATAVAAAGILSFTNNLDGPNLTLSGSTALLGKDVGTQALTTAYATPTRVQSATGSSGSTATTTLSVTLPNSPAPGNTLIAVISTRGSSAGRVSAISQTGTAWTRAAQATHASGTTTEIWVAPNISAAAKALTISQASLISAAVVMEYAGVLSPTPLDQTANATGSSTAALTGTTPTTAQANELWIAGIGIADGRRTLNAPYGGSFSVVASPSTGATSTDAMVYALDHIVSATGAAASSGTLSTSSPWAGTLATFKAALGPTLTLGGSAAPNYTLSGATGSVQITPKPLTVIAVTASKTYDGSTAAAGTPTLAPPLAAGDTTSVLAQFFQDPSAGAGNKVIVPNITISDGNGGNNYAVTPVNFTNGTIDKAAATVTLGGLARNFDGTPKAATATTAPPGLTVTYTYDAATTEPTNPGSYAVVATVSDVNYSGSASGTLVIAAELIDIWRAAHFTSAEITAGLAADGSDADGDGLNNRDEYALGTDPRSFSPQPLALTRAGDHFTLGFLARAASGPGYAGLTRIYEVEASSDLTTWQTFQANIVGNDQTVTLDTAAQHFYRLKIRLE